MGHIETSRGLVTAPRLGRLFFAFCLLFLPAGPAGANYGGGSGTADDPYLIYTAEQMNTIGLHKEDWDKHFKLMADLDLSVYKGTSFNRIGFHDPTTFPDGVHYLIAGPFDCRGYRNVQLQFARWLNTDSARYVDAMVEVSRDGTSWTTVWKYTGTEEELTDSVWKTVVCDIRGTADDQQEVYIRWGYEVLSIEARPMSGWNIDDITLTGLPD